jgi:hypothetical protein
MSEIEIMISALQREAIERIRQRMAAEQLGEAFSDLPTAPLITSLVPSGMDSLIAKKPPQARPSLRKAVAK